MNLYERYVLPRLIDLAMRTKATQAERARAIPLAAGTVLEVGIGSGLNLPFYGSAVERLYGVDPRRELWTLAPETDRARAVSRRVHPGVGRADPDGRREHRHRRDDVDALLDS